MKKRNRLIIVLLVVVLCGIFLYPTVKWYGFVPQTTKDLATGSNVQIREYARGQASRDARALLDLVKGNPDADVPSEFGYLKGAAKATYKASKESVPSKWTVSTLLRGFYTEKDLLDAIEDHYRSELTGLKKLSGKALQLGLDLQGGMSVLLDADVEGYTEKTGITPSSSQVTSLVNEDIEILKTRIDQFGVSEPEIRLQGSDQIAIEVPGASDPERINSFLRGKGSLTFQMVDTDLTTQLQQYFAEHPTEAFNDDGSIRQPSFLPAGKVATGYYVNDEYGIDELQRFVVLNSEVALDGEHLESATTSTDGITGRPVVNFQLDSTGGDLFYKLTSANVGNTLAVVMDGNVKAMATINEAIRSSVQISGFSQKEADDLAIVLKTAALPINLTVASQQSVGATLGDDAVHAAMFALLIGIGLIILFMIAEYKVSGLVADLALVFNLVIMLALLTSFGFTVTLSSVAGLVLTLGMAVDSNVIINERIKEELRAGKSDKAAVNAGYGKAFWTIMDANVTTIIAGLVLSFLGSSAVKGFANTLCVGIISSVFTSLFVTHLIMDAAVTDNPTGKLNISWRKSK